jgi:hypothetical protein
MMEASMGESHMIDFSLTGFPYALGLFPRSQVEEAQSLAFELPSVDTLQSNSLCLWALMSLIA